MDITIPLGKAMDILRIKGFEPIVIIVGEAAIDRLKQQAEIWKRAEEDNTPIVMEMYGLKLVESKLIPEGYIAIECSDPNKLFGVKFVLFKVDQV